MAKIDRPWYTQDPRVNRLEDSFQLWKSVIENKLLSHVNIVLFLNKCDLLKKKLDAGVRVANYVASYNHPNDYTTVSQCRSLSTCRDVMRDADGRGSHSTGFCNRFVGMHWSLTPNKDRELFSASSIPLHT